MITNARSIGLLCLSRPSAVMRLALTMSVARPRSPQTAVRYLAHLTCFTYNQMTVCVDGGLARLRIVAMNHILVTRWNVQCSTRKSRRALVSKRRKVLGFLLLIKWIAIGKIVANLRRLVLTLIVDLLQLKPIQACAVVIVILDSVAKQPPQPPRVHLHRRHQ